MANFTAADVKALRDRLGTGMLDSKNALVEADGDMEKAVEILRLKGAKNNAKRSDRSTSEGLVAAVENGSTATMIELDCETDFVAKSEKFVNLAQAVLDAAAAVRAGSVEEALAAQAGSRTVAQLIEEDSAVLGEKVELRRVVSVDAEKFSIYLHKTS
ncbi:MAG: translation elongation factor Ts, partial [Microbacteriaceae bacterium]|nr:translation elongation factor Ts [Microbacteriaceae bacterium]